MSVVTHFCICNRKKTSSHLSILWWTWKRRSRRSTSLLAKVVLVQMAVAIIGRYLCTKHPRGVAQCARMLAVIIQESGSQARRLLLLWSEQLEESAGGPIRRLERLTSALHENRSGSKREDWSAQRSMGAAVRYNTATDCPGTQQLRWKWAQIPCLERNVFLYGSKLLRAAKVGPLGALLVQIWYCICCLSSSGSLAVALPCCHAVLLREGPRVERASLGCSRGSRCYEHLRYVAPSQLCRCCREPIFSCVH